MPTYLISPKDIYSGIDDNGNPLVGGKLYTYIAGSATPAPTYTSASGVTENANPIILDARGEARVWLSDDLVYKYILKDALDVTIRTTDNIQANSGDSGGDLSYVAHEDTLSIDMSGLGTAVSPLTASVLISSISANALGITTGGLYVSDLTEAVADKLDKVQVGAQSVASEVTFNDDLINPNMSEWAFTPTNNSQLLVFGDNGEIQKTSNPKLEGGMSFLGSNSYQNVGSLLYQQATPANDDIFQINSTYNLRLSASIDLRFDATNYNFQNVPDGTPTETYGQNASGELVKFDPEIVAESTGVKTGGVLSTGAGSTQFSITDGTGQIVTNTGVMTSVTWTSITNITPTLIGSTARTYIALDNAGLLVQSSTDFTIDQSRTLIILGIVVHLDNINVNAVNNQQHIAYNAMSSTYDLAEAIGIFNVNGNLFSGNGANLNMNKSVGNVFRAGTNYDTDVNNPHEPTIALSTQQSFTYVYNNNATGATGIAIDPANLDDGAGGLTALSNNTKWSVQRVYLFTSGIVAVQRGVEEFDTQDDAINGIDGEAYIIASSIEPNALLRGWLVARKNATDLTDIATAKFIEAPKFGSGGGASGGSPALVDLQTAYINSVTPEIITDATRGAVTLRNGQSLDTDKVIEIENIAGTVTASTDGDGCGRLTTLDVVHEALGTDDHALEIDANANGFGDVKALDIDYITGAIASGDDEAAILVNIDKFASTGGDIVALEVLSTSGGATTTAMLAGADVGVIEQTSGTFGDMDSALVNATDRLTEFTTIGSDVQMFVADNDTVTIGNLAKFEEIEFILAIVASQNINPTFEYSTGVGTWGTFTPIDGTNGMKNTGLIAWLDSDIPTWAVGTASEFLIRITRTRNGLSTPPTESLVQIAETTEFYWNKDGDVKINDLEVVGAGDFGGLLTASATSGEVMRVGYSSSDGSYAGWFSGTSRIGFIQGFTNRIKIGANSGRHVELEGDYVKTPNNFHQGAGALDLAFGTVVDSLKSYGAGEFSGLLTSNTALNVLNSIGYGTSSDMKIEIGASNEISVDASKVYKWFFETSGDASGQILKLKRQERGVGSLSSIILSSTLINFRTPMHQGAGATDASFGIVADSIKSYGAGDFSGPLTVKSAGDSILYVGDDTNTATDLLTGIRTLTNHGSGNIFIDHKTKTGANIDYRCGEGAEAGYSHLFMRVDPTDGGLKLLDVEVDSLKSNGVIESESFAITALNTAPTSATDTGTRGEIRYTEDYMYVCTATNTWKRSAITTW
tara:strand:+ start:12367 stop:16146 length:3780 start_codon:yes stop_codon:yes gene_type:complete